MPKIINARLVGLTGDFAGDEVETGIAVAGVFFGVTFGEMPEQQGDIFGFADGPVLVRHHNTTAIGAANSFSLRNPTQDPPGVFPMSLRFGGQLVSAQTGQPFAEQFKAIDTFTHTQPDIEHLHVLRFIDGNQEIRADFVLRITSTF